MKQSFYDKLEPTALLFFTVYALGLTAGCLVGAGEGGLVVEPERGAAYGAGAFFRALPFFMLALIPGKKRLRTAAGLLAAGAFGAVTGVAAVQALLSAEPLKAALLCVLPRLLSQLPSLILVLCLAQRMREIPFDYSAVLTRLLLSVLACFLASCAQFAFFTVFAQFY